MHTHPLNYLLLLIFRMPDIKNNTAQNTCNTSKRIFLVLQPFDTIDAISNTEHKKQHPDAKKSITIANFFIVFSFQLIYTYNMKSSKFYKLHYKYIIIL